ncbi:G6PD family protein [Megaselia abdita]
MNDQQNTLFVIFGASGDLARRKIYPVLWYLFRDQLLPPGTRFVGYSRSTIVKKNLEEKSKPFMKITGQEKVNLSDFWDLHSFVSGSYSDDADFKKLETYLASYGSTNRIFYLALPPSVFEDVTTGIKKFCMAKSPVCHTRVIIEKPFGRDSASSAELSEHLAQLFKESQMYRIDHYLGKEMVQNLMTLRFGNGIFSHLWSRSAIASVQVTFKENIGTLGRMGYFDSFGIIRDVMQNHLLQIVALVAMARPVSISASDIRDEKVRVLRAIPPLKLEDCVIGQYTGDKNADPKSEAWFGYKDDESVPQDSQTPTFALTVLKIDNEQWEGVPFIMRAGKGLNEGKAEIRIQFKDVAGNLFGKSARRNELVMRVQPGEAIYMKINTKTPGSSGFEFHETEMDLTYKNRYTHHYIPDAYERLILDVFQGNQMNFVRADELSEAWRIFTPVLKKMEDQRIEPLKYVFGSRGPEEADEMCRKQGVEYSGTYQWKQI